MELIPDLGPFRYVAGFLVAFVLSLYFTPVIRKGAIRYGVVDQPDGQLKVHKEPVAYLGGVAIYLSFLFALAFTYEFDAEVLGLLLSASIIVMLGLFDDLKVLTPEVKLLGQIVAAVVLIKAGIMIRLTFLPQWSLYPLTIFWLVGVTNAINLIDVSDGLAAGTSAIAGSFLYGISVWNGHTTIAMLTLALVGACLGFLAFNRPPARIYLGDAGSMFLGFMLGALAMKGHYTFNHRVGAVAPVVILGVPIFDTFFVMGVRAVRRLPLMHGSPDHFAVRLRNHGVRSGIIAVLGYGAAIMLGVCAMLLVYVPRLWAYGVLAFLAVAALAVVLGLWRLGREPRERSQQQAASPS